MSRIEVSPEDSTIDAETRPADAERILTGIGVSPGIALGTVSIADFSTVKVPEILLSAENIPAELGRFDAAVAASRQQLLKLKTRSAQLPGVAGEEAGFLLDAHLAMLTRSRLLRGVSDRIERDLINAEAAVGREIEAIAESFSLMDDPYLAARIEDVRAVGRRVVRNLANNPTGSLGHLPSGTILLAEELSPAETALMNPAQIVAFATVLGGAEGHTAIMARALGIPAVVGCLGLLDVVEPGEMILVDGSSGTVTLNPSPETLAMFDARCVLLARERRNLAQLRNLPAVTRDGVTVALEANLNMEQPRELAQALSDGASGIGLVRTEFLFMNRVLPPTEDEQAEALSKIVQGMDGRPVTIRTLDVGGDKLADSLRPLVGECPNPALGLRAIRLTLKHRPLLETHFRAILRAGQHGPIRILLPMISDRREVVEARAVLRQVHAEMMEAGIDIPVALPPVGIMIEVPGAALAADALAREADFFSIGTNDLTQYTLAIDRADEQVAHLYNPLHPAVLRLIQFAAVAAQRAAIPISVCGEVAGDPRFTPLLIGLGIQNLSMSPGSLLRVKQRIRRLDLRDAVQLAEAIMAESDDQRIAALLERAAI